MQELLAARTAHGPGVGLHDHVLQAQPLEDPLVGVSLLLVGDVEAGIRVVEGIRVLHRELAPAQEAGARPRLVPVLVLDLVDRQRQVFVRTVEVLHQQREGLFVSGGEQVVRTLAVLQAENAIAILDPSPGLLVRLAWQERGKVHLLRTGRLHFLTDDGLDLATHLQPERQPGEHPWRLATDVAGPHEEAVADDLRIGRVFTKGADKKVGEACWHENYLSCGAQRQFCDGDPRIPRGGLE